MDVLFEHRVCKICCGSATAATAASVLDSNANILDSSTSILDSSVSILDSSANILDSSDSSLNLSAAPKQAPKLSLVRRLSTQIQGRDLKIQGLKPLQFRGETFRNQGRP